MPLVNWAESRLSLLWDPKERKAYLVQGHPLQKFDISNAKHTDTTTQQEQTR